MKRRAAIRSAVSSTSFLCQCHSIISIFALLVLLSALVFGCSPSTTPAPSASPSATPTAEPTASPSPTPTATKTPTSTATATGSAYSIAVFQNDKQVGVLKLADLQSLPPVSFTAEGKDEKGVSLTAALKLVRITDFSEVTAYGLTRGRIATAEITLQKAQINDNVILDFSNQGTAKLASPDIPSNNWIIDVNKIEVK